MNRRGFTLIELLAVIVIIGILGVLIVPGILNNIDTAKENSYNTLIKNIVTSSQMYYEECEYGDLSNKTKYNEYACEIKKDTEARNDYIETTLGTLANTGFLNVKDIRQQEDGSTIKIVKNPKNESDISFCTIKITKKVNKTTYKVTYTVENLTSGDTCPAIYQ